MNLFKNLKMRFDGFTNVLTGQGLKGRDKLQSSRTSARRVLSEQEATDMYTGDGIAHRIIEQMIIDMFREGFKVETGSKEDITREVMERFEEIGLIPKIEELIRWGRVYGGAIGILGINDGSAKMELPLNEAGVRSIEFMRVYPRYHVQWTSLDLYKDSNHPKFNMPEFYNIQPVEGSPYRVHESRCIIYDGEPLPPREKYTNQGWGASILEICYDRILSMDSAYHSVDHVLKDFAQGVLSVPNLMSMMSGKAGDDLITKRLDLFDMSRSIMNTMIIDSQETYTKVITTIAGIPEAIDRFAEGLSTPTMIPVKILLGRQTAGMGSTDSADVRLWYDFVAATQISKLRPILEKLVRLELSTKSNSNGDWKITFNPLWQLTDLEQAQVNNTQAQADCAYVTAQVLSPDEVASSRFGSNESGLKTTLGFDRSPEAGMPEPEDENVIPPGTQVA